MSPDPQPGRPRAFATTHWSVVLAARDLRRPESRDALAALVDAYWLPLYAFARRRGHDADDAADLVQGFFARLLETSGLRGADRDKGRFRSYLLGAFRHFEADQRARAAAAKRGGGDTPLSLDAELAEHRYALEPRDDATPEAVYERRWALTVLWRALGRLRGEYEASGKAELYEALEPQLTGGARRGALKEAAARLGKSEGATRVAAHRLRARFAELLHHEVAQTVADAGDVDAELRHLLDTLGG